MVTCTDVHHQPSLMKYRSFYIQCPLTITAIVLVAWKLDGPPEEDEPKTSKEKLRRIDFLGSISLALAIVGFLLILDIGGQKVPWTHPLVWILFGAASVFSIIFVLVEAYVAREPIFPLRLIVHRDVLSAYLVTALLGAAQFGVNWPCHEILLQSPNDTYLDLGNVFCASLLPSHLARLNHQCRRTPRSRRLRQRHSRSSLWCHY